MIWINISSHKLTIAGKIFRINLKIISNQRFFKDLKISLSSGTFGGSFKAYNSIYNDYLSNNICSELINTDGNLYLPGKK